MSTPNVKEIVREKYGQAALREVLQLFDFAEKSLAFRDFAEKQVVDF